MTQLKLGRNYRIDVLKGIAIIAVVLYHFGGGYLAYGYLGVDIFLVISGYFMMKSIMKSMDEKRFSYWNFLFGRIARLWPLVLIMGAVALAIGCFTMLPDDLENLSQSVIASNVFANNILACITTRNYWDIVNTYKPLMHTWYLGVLMQAYVIFPLIYMVVFKISKGNRNAVKMSVTFITLLSLLLYLLPVAASEQKFYYLPFRAFEITVGSLLVFMPEDKIITKKVQYSLEVACLAVILFFICMPIEVPVASVKLLAIVFATVILVYVFAHTEEKLNPCIKLFANIGKASFSIYLCHQIVVAYMYYAVTDRTDLYVLLAFIAVVAVISVATYFLAEKTLNAIAKRSLRWSYVLSVAVFLITSSISGFIYLRAGVIRDVPELGIDKNNVHRGMHAEYCDIPYSWNKDFSDSDKVKVLVIGDSFGRDWANILNESSISDKIEISYIYLSSDLIYQQYENRISQADVVFRTYSNSTANIADSLPDIISNDKLYIVGYKNFGSSNGIIYNHRQSEDYFEQSITLDEEVLNNNQILKQTYGDHYIDMIQPVQNEDGSIRVFTDDHYFISQDCRHLTKFGAQYYACIMDLSWILNGEKMYETLLTNEECANAVDLGKFYRVPSDKRGLNYDKYFSNGDNKRNLITEFNSSNTDLLDVNEVKEKLLSLKYIQDELSKGAGK